LGTIVAPAGVLVKAIVYMCFRWNGVVILNTKEIVTVSLSIMERNIFPKTWLLEEEEEKQQSAFNADFQ
jgi:hypothetical protein